MAQFTVVINFAARTLTVDQDGVRLQDVDPDIALSVGRKDSLVFKADEEFEVKIVQVACPPPKQAASVSTLFRPINPPQPITGSPPSKRPFEGPLELRSERKIADCGQVQPGALGGDAERCYKYTVTMLRGNSQFDPHIIVRG